MAVQTERPAPATESCPICGAAAERGQLVCLECGSRVALTYRRPPSWRIPVAIAVVVVGLFLVGAAVAVTAIGNDAEQEVAAAPPRPAAATSNAGRTAPRTATRTKGLVRRGDLYTWPRDLQGYTVVINSTENRDGAVAFARSAAKRRPAKVGVIRADDFRSLPQGFYIVFGGSYPSRAQADKATARLGDRFSGAFTQRVRR